MLLTWIKLWKFNRVPNSNLTRSLIRSDLQNVKVVFDAAIKVVLQPPKPKRKRRKARKCVFLWAEFHVILFLLWQTWLPLPNSDAQPIWPSSLYLLFILIFLFNMKELMLLCFQSNIYIHMKFSLWKRSFLLLAMGKGNYLHFKTLLFQGKMWYAMNYIESLWLIGRSMCQLSLNQTHFGVNTFSFSDSMKK